MPSNCTIISWKGKKEMASLLKGSKGGGGAPVARSGSGPGRCFSVFPKGPAPVAQRGLWHPSGLWPDGCQGLCSKVASHRENDSLHFVRRSAPSKCVRCASLRSGGRRLAVRTAMGNHIGAMPRTPFPASRDFPSRGNERYEGKKQRVIYFRYHFGVFPLWWLAPPPSHLAGKRVT